MRTRGSMKSLETKLIDGSCDEVIRFSYASTRASIADHAAGTPRRAGGAAQATRSSALSGTAWATSWCDTCWATCRKSDPAGLLEPMPIDGHAGSAQPGRRDRPTSGSHRPVRIRHRQRGVGAGSEWEELQKRLGDPTFSRLSSLPATYRTTPSRIRWSTAPATWLSVSTRPNWTEPNAGNRPGASQLSDERRESPEVNAGIHQGSLGPATRRPIGSRDGLPSPIPLDSRIQHPETTNAGINRRLRLQ